MLWRFYRSLRDIRDFLDAVFYAVAQPLLVRDTCEAGAEVVFGGWSFWGARGGVGLVGLQELAGACVEGGGGC